MILLEIGRNYIKEILYYYFKKHVKKNNYTFVGKNKYYYDEDNKKYVAEKYVFTDDEGVDLYEILNTYDMEKQAQKACSKSQFKYLNNKNRYYYDVNYGVYRVEYYVDTNDDGIDRYRDGDSYSLEKKAQEAAL